MKTLQYDGMTFEYDERAPKRYSVQKALALGASVPDRPRRVDDVPRGQREAGGRYGRARVHVPNLVACALQFVSPRSGEDRPADTASCHEARVGGVDDGVYVQMGDVLANQGEWHVGLACVGGSAAMRPLKEECTAGGAACLPRALLRWRKGLADMR